MKIAEETLVTQIKARRFSHEVAMSNGLTVCLYEFEAYGIAEEAIVVNQKIDVEFTPNNKMILKMVLK